MEITGITAHGHQAALQLEGGLIGSLSLNQSPDLSDARQRQDAFLGPGFLDIQVNGFAGVDFNHPGFEAADLEPACRAMLSTGVTGFLATLITAGYDHLGRALGQIMAARAASPLVRAMVKGIHLEGPHICKEDGARGAHDPAWVSPPDWTAFKRLYDLSRGLIRLVTLAPELPGALEFIRRAAELGVVAGLGHCNPGPEVICQAAGAGARLSTHLGNGAHEMLHRHRNYIQAQMAEDRLMASIICDGHHLPGYFIKNLVRAKGPGRVILITDAIAAAGSGPGKYTLGGLEVETGADGVSRLPGTPYLAGSTLTMDRAVINCARAAGHDPAAALDMATANPARLFPDMGGVLAQGRPADLIRFRLGTKRVEVLEAYLGGELAFTAG